MHIYVTRPRWIDTLTIVLHWYFVRLRLSVWTLQWRQNERDGVSNRQPHNCLLNRLFRRRSKKTSKPRVTGLCEGNSPVISEFPTQRASNAESVSIWWRHHENCPICENVSQHPYSQSNFEKYITTCIPLCSHHQRACWYLPRDLICASRPSAATCTARFRTHQ